MSSGTIGIKIADRTYFPILERGEQSRKRLVLTTVNEKQESVQIDLYENQRQDMQSAAYIGSLLIERIAPGAAGEAEVELVISHDSDGTLSASASDASSGDSQSLSVSLESLAKDSIYDVPEFELDEVEGLDDGVAGNQSVFEDDEPDTDSYDAVGADEQAAIVERRRPLVLALYIALGIAAIVLITVLLFSLFKGPKVPPLQAIGDQQAQVAGSSQAESASSTQPVGGGPAEGLIVGRGQDGAAPVGELALGGTWYWVRPGDTLVSLSTSFYRVPEFYQLIADRNNIANPDLIHAGSRIYIPSR